MISQRWHHAGTRIFTKCIYLSFLYDRYMFEIRVLEVLLPNIPGARCNVLIWCAALFLISFCHVFSDWARRANDTIPAHSPAAMSGGLLQAGLIAVPWGDGILALHRTVWRTPKQSKARANHPQEDSVCFDSDGCFISNKHKTSVAERFARDHVIGVLLSLDPVPRMQRDMSSCVG